MPRANASKWLLLIHQIPVKPDYLRVKIRRRLGQLGAVALKNSVYLLPADAEGRTGLSALALERRGARGGEESHRRRVAQALERVRARFDQTVIRDVFGAQGRETAVGLLSLVEDLVQGVEETAKRPLQAPELPKGVTWVTRTGVMVDRIASAWLIRRFIDPAARFKFVSGRGYRPREGELRFDMAGAEFTHHEGRCTFEVLVDRFRLRDSALKPIAEIVHDLDMEDGRYNRPEAAGVDRMIVGLAIARQGDETRIAQGSTVFENLYESFRRRAS